jgi:hypothetical protein
MPGPIGRNTLKFAGNEKPLYDAAYVFIHIPNTLLPHHTTITPRNQQARFPRLSRTLSQKKQPAITPNIHFNPHPGAFSAAPKTGLSGAPHGNLRLPRFGPGCAMAKPMKQLP